MASISSRASFVRTAALVGALHCAPLLALALIDGRLRQSWQTTLGLCALTAALLIPALGWVRRLDVSKLRHPRLQIASRIWLSTVFSVYVLSVLVISIGAAAKEGLLLGFMAFLGAAGFGILILAAYTLVFLPALAVSSHLLFKDAQERE